MNFIETVKRIFKNVFRIQSNKSEVKTPYISGTTVNNERTIVEEQKAEEERVEERRAEQRKLEEKWAEERRAATKRVEERTAAKKRTEEQRAKEKKLEELRTEEQRAEDRRLEEKWAEQRRLEELRTEEIRAEEKKLEELRSVERRAEEREHLKRIHKLYHENFVQYLNDAQKFRDDFGKNIKCDICGDWENDLHNYCGQTYCEKHIPHALQRENERKIIAGKHGSSRDFIKK